MNTQTKMRVILPAREISSHPSSGDYRYQLVARPIDPVFVGIQRSVYSNDEHIKAVTYNQNIEVSKDPAGRLVWINPDKTKYTPEDLIETANNMENDKQDSDLKKSLLAESDIITDTIIDIAVRLRDELDAEKLDTIDIPELAKNIVVTAYINRRNKYK